MTLLECKAKICLTAAGVLIHKNKVLLVKHKKLGIWLNPGGHIEADEAPHLAAEREVREETGLETRAIFIGPKPENPDTTEYQPNPFLTNLHWVCEDNYKERTSHPDTYEPKAPWKRGCEQHLNLVYLVELVGDEKVIFDESETDDIRWFTQKELLTEDIKPSILSEINIAFDIAKKLN